MKGSLKRILIATFFIAGCATVASGPSFVDYKNSISNLDSNYGRIFFYRTNGLGAFRHPNVILAGEKIGEAVAQGFFYVDRPAGHYKLGVGIGKLSFTLDKGETRYIRLGVSKGSTAHFYPEWVKNKIGKHEILFCNFIQSKD